MEEEEDKEEEEEIIYRATGWRYWVLGSVQHEEEEKGRGGGRR